jgi:hypothetical protein
MKNIASKLVLIAQECAVIFKSGINEFHKYSYAQASDIAKMINTALVKHGIVTTVHHEVLHFATTVNKNKNEEKVVTVKATVTFIDSESGETLTTTGLGCGQDIGDKAIMKGETAALKYAYIQCFNIACGEDPEADGSVDERMGAERQKPSSSASKPQQSPPSASKSQYSCSNCGDPITEKVSTYSTDVYKRPLCYKCQKQ